MSEQGLGAAIDHITGRSVLYVDGVEGSLAVKPKIIKAAIESYARECGFSAVAYNKFIHNRVPSRFVKYVGKNRCASLYLGS